MNALRPDPQPFSIMDEYPLLFDDRDSSWVVRDQITRSILAHANVMPRDLLDASGNALFKICLIGNVATRPESRGQGIMRALLEFLESEAAKIDCRAVLLWSDLLSFYQSSGYQTLGTEQRFFIRVNHLKSKALDDSIRVRLCAPSEVDSKMAERLLELRLRGFPTVRRTPDEFCKLLTIPACSLYLLESKGITSGFCLVGKGADMAGVIHEWGASDPHTLMTGAGQILSSQGLNEIILLSPSTMPNEFQNALNSLSDHVERCPMALGKILQDHTLDAARNQEPEKQKTPAEVLGEGFIWGLDSI